MIKQSIYEREVSKILKKAGYKFQQEYKFCPDRKWRLDFALLPLKVKIGIEIEGATWSGGRHSRGQGFENDCEKYNKAQILGWLILRYTTQTIPHIIRDLKELGKPKKNRCPKFGYTAGKMRPFIEKH